MEVNLHAFLAEVKEDLPIMTASPLGQLSPVVGVSVLYGYETWSLTFRKERKLRV